MVIIVKEQGNGAGWNPSVVLATLSGLESDETSVSEAQRSALYRSWFADDDSVCPETWHRSVRKIAWLAADDLPTAVGGDRAARLTV